MSSVCISSCLTDAKHPQAPFRATYLNLYKWPESDAEFVRSRSSGTIIHRGQSARFVDSISCRQIYLTSYRFSRKETVPEKTVKCFGKVKHKVGAHGNKKKRKSSKQKRCIRRKCLVWKKVKVALSRFFNRLLSCSDRVNVVDQPHVSFR